MVPHLHAIAAAAMLSLSCVAAIPPVASAPRIRDHEPTTMRWLLLVAAALLRVVHFCLVLATAIVVRVVVSVMELDTPLAACVGRVRAVRLHRDEAGLFVSDQTLSGFGTGRR